MQRQQSPLVNIIPGEGIHTIENFLEDSEVEGR